MKKKNHGSEVVYSIVESLPSCGYVPPKSLLPGPITYVYYVLRLQPRTTPWSCLVHYLLFIESMGLVATRNSGLHHVPYECATYS